MTVPLPPPRREAERLAALYQYEILDTPPEKELDDLVHLAAHICDTPIALMSLVDSDRQWFKSKKGLTATETSRYIAFCSHTILGDDLLIVPDALADERFATNPLVTGDPHIRFYCGAPLITPDGYRIGTLNVIDHIPRDLSAAQMEAMRVLSRQVMDHLTLDREHRELIQAVNERQAMELSLRESEAKFRTLSETTSSGIYVYRGDRFLYANPAALSITGYTREELLAMSLWDLVHPAFRESLQARVQALQRGEEVPPRIEFQIIRKNGEPRWLDFTSASVEMGGEQVRIGTAYDITGHKRTEALNAAQRHFLEQALENRPLAETMDSLVRAIEALSDGGVCSILLADRETGTLHHGAVSTLPEPYSRMVDGLAIGPCHGSCGTAAYRKEAVVVEDIATDPLWVPWPAASELALAHGLKACTSMPILDGESEVLGTYAMYFREARRPTAFELLMLRAASQTLRVAIERRQADDALRVSEERMEAILNNSPQIVFVKNLDGRYLFTNRLFEQRFGFSPNQAIGKTDDDLFSPDQAAQFRQHDREAIQAGQAVEFEEVARYEDGEHISIAMKFPLRSADGAPSALCGIVTDITERKQMEEAVRRSEERFQLVALATNDILWDWNLLTDDYWWSPAACEKFGYDPVVEPDISSWTSRLHPDDRDGNLQRLDAALAGREQAWSDEYRFRCADGTYGHFLDRGHIVRDAVGKPVRMIGAMTDVSAAKQAYVSLKEAYARLTVMNREVQAAEEKERRRLSRELHDEFGQLLSALKFDLAGIEAALRPLRSSAARRCRTKVEQAAGTVDRLFTSFREVLAALRPAVLEVLGLVSAIEAMAGDVQERTGLRCTVVAERKDAGLVCGPDVEGTIYRMAQELVMNVVRHANATEAEITLETGGGWVLLEVRDDGVGFNPSDIPGEGRFGLRGIRERAEMFGGTVSIQSAPGRGAVVTVRLPCDPAAGSEPSPAGSRTVTSSRAARGRRHGKT